MSENTSELVMGVVKAAKALVSGWEQRDRCYDSKGEIQMFIQSCERDLELAVYALGGNAGRQ